ncbi:uncharacterized protein LOC111624171 [Centruroides sculpturatus]|uniref:uncharacterized protein LOC111624171 n=1 Tax=Centruroides sculpturatus TaxID=218467 RepID=UPI000C6E7E07|nr:uncharacterized protein LOC111624171 [Centruroides sculpturatus]
MFFTRIFLCLVVQIIIIEVTARREKSPENSEVIPRNRLNAMAKKYNAKVHREGSCSKPVAKLIPVGTSPEKIYVPHCAILHRCSEDTGCCHSSRKVCLAKKTEKVTLPFRVFELLINGTYDRGEPIFLNFLNHTKCACTRVRLDRL